MTLGRGLRSVHGRDDRRLKEMVALRPNASATLDGEERSGGRVNLLDRSCGRTSWRQPENQLSVAVLVRHASYLFPAGEPGRLSFAASAMRSPS